MYPKFACAVRGAAGGGTGLGPPAVPSVPFSKIFQKVPSTMISYSDSIADGGDGPNRTGRGHAHRTGAHPSARCGRNRGNRPAKSGPRLALLHHAQSGPAQSHFFLLLEIALLWLTLGSHAQRTPLNMGALHCVTDNHVHINTARTSGEFKDMRHPLRLRMHEHPRLRHYY